MELLDSAYQNFEKLLLEIKGYEGTIFSEQDTRVKVIDRIFIEVLNWTYGDFLTEEKAGKGFLDYKFSIDSFAKLIVEAKKDGRDLGVKARVEGRPYKLNGPTFKGQNVQEGIEQAINYSARKGSELACVTNGREWIVFRGSLVGTGTDIYDGMAFVFTSLDEVKEHFALFYDLLSYEAIKEYKYRAFFQEAEGHPLRTHVFKKALRTADSKRMIKFNNLSPDIDRVMGAFFQKISGQDDPELLKECFIVTKESEAADQKLLRISEDIIGKIRSLETDKGKELEKLLRIAKETPRNEFVILIGHKGSGKSTFIDRFFTMVLQRELRNQCIVVKLDLKQSNGDENKIHDWLDEKLLREMEHVLYQENTPSYEDIQGMFFDEYVRWKDGSYKYLYEKNKEDFKIEFGKHIETKREENPFLYLCRLIERIIKSRKKLPCIIFDNADHFSIEFQERVFQYARSIYENELCFIVMPITDKTSWQLSRQGALESFDSEVLYLPVPAPERVLEKRIRHIERKLEEDKGKKTGGRYFFSKGITLKIENLEAFVCCLQNIFLGTGYVGKWMGSLSNFDIRRCLELARMIMSSPYIDVPELFKVYIAKDSMVIRESLVKTAAIRDKYDIYPVGEHKFIQNIYSLNSEIDTTPFLGLSILQLLLDAPDEVVRGEKSYVEVKQIFDYLSAMTIKGRVIELWLDTMLKTGLCRSYDPTVREISKAKRIEISPSGRQHYYWGINDDTYLTHMIYVTPILDKEVFDKINSLMKVRKPRETWAEKLVVFLDYLLSEDANNCSISEHPSMEGQKKFRRRIEGKISRVRKTRNVSDTGVSHEHK